MTRFSAIFLITLLLSHYTYSADLADEVADLSQGRLAVDSHDARSRLAEGLLSEVLSLLNALPTPEPSDVLWVVQERLEISELSASSDAYRNRLQQFAVSVTALHVRLDEALRRVEDALRCAASPESPREEFACWAEASFHLGHPSVFSSSIPLLQRHDILPSNATIDSADMIFNQSARDIHQHLIIPFLRNEIPQ